MEDSFADGNDATALPPASSLPLRSQSQYAAPLTDDPSDDFCRVCGFGVSASTLLLSHSCHSCLLTQRRQAELYT